MSTKGRFLEMNQSDFDRRIVTLAAANTNKILKDTAGEMLASLGYTRWIYASENPYGALGFPATLANDYGKWMLMYMAKGYMKVDPIVAHCRASKDPYYWDAHEGWEEASEKVQALMKDAASQGFFSGLAMALHLPGEPPGMLHVTSPDSLSESRAQFEASLPQLRKIGQAMHKAMIGIMKETARIQQRLKH